MVGEGTFTIIGQWSDELDLVVGEIGTVVSDGSSASQVAPSRGNDMVTAAYVAPDGCKWGFLCAVGRGFKSLWNWGQAQWDTLSSGVLTLAGYVWDIGKGCFANVVDAINAVKDVLVKLKQFAMDPIGFVTGQLEVLQKLVEAIRADPGGFSREVLEGVFETDLLVTEPFQWAGKVGCQVALALLTGGGALATKLGGATKLLNKINKFLDSTPIGGRIDRVLPDRNTRGNDRDTDRKDDDGRDDDDEGAPKCLVGNSFPSGTPVRMANGSLLAIEQIQPGDRVLAANPIHGNWSSQLVLDQWSHVDDGKMATVVLADGSRVTATDHHQFWVASDGTWLELEDIQAGDLLLTPTGITRVAAVARHSTAQTLVWELDTTGPNTFTVHTGTSDVLVHNAGCRQRTDKDDLTEDGLTKPSPPTPGELTALERWVGPRNDYLDEWFEKDWDLLPDRTTPQNLSARLAAVDNAIENHLTPDDLAGMLKELRGIETGFDHINEVDNALNSVNNAISAITQQLNNPSDLSPGAIQQLADKLAGLESIRNDVDAVIAAAGT